MNIFVSLVVILLSSYLATYLARKLKIPTVVALILNGIFIGIPVLRNTLLEPNLPFITAIGDVGLISMMFVAGLESSWKVIYKERKDAMIIAIFAAVVPFLLGFFVFYMLGFSFLISSIVGICMSITAEATKASVLMELNRLKSKIGATMMGAGIIDDIAGLSLFILVNYLLKEVFIKEDLLLAGVIVSFFIGIIVQKSIGREHKIIHSLEKALIICIIPFFFISMGLHFDMNSLILKPTLLILILVIATSGKLLGVFLTKPFNKFSWAQLHLIGWGMNSRGAVEMAIALIAFRGNLIPIELYSSLVVMALLSTMIFPFIMTHLIRKRPRIMG